MSDLSLFTNKNTLWSYGIIKTLVSCGVNDFIVSPGSRSSPLVFAIEAIEHAKGIPILDERSAAFFALGIAKSRKKPVALLCTSGSAVAHYLPAIIEAKMSNIPLIILTADRPPELQHCYAGQTIDQKGIYGNYVKGFLDLSVPEAQIEKLSELRNRIVASVEESLEFTAGPYHINVPFKEPLLPLKDEEWSNLLFSSEEIEAIFSVEVSLAPRAGVSHFLSSMKQENERLSSLMAVKEGVILVGNNHGLQMEDLVSRCNKISSATGWPVLADAISSLRNVDEIENLVVHYDAILRKEQDLPLQSVLLIGELPTSKVLRNWIKKKNPQLGMICSASENRDPMKVRSFHLSWKEVSASETQESSSSKYKTVWQERDEKYRSFLHDNLGNGNKITEVFIPWFLSQNLNSSCNVFISSSMPVRDAEFFWQSNNSGAQMFCNRGANGIDGILSTALGVAHEDKITYLLTGDLAFLHDSNGLLIAPEFDGKLVVLLINNQGGGIFENLPVAAWDNVFEKYFITKQEVDFKSLVTSYADCSHETINCISDFKEAIKVTKFDEKIRVLELVCRRENDVKMRKSLLEP